MLRFMLKQKWNMKYNIKPESYFIKISPLKIFFFFFFFFLCLSLLIIHYFTGNYTLIFPKDTLEMNLKTCENSRMMTNLYHSHHCPFSFICGSTLTVHNLIITSFFTQLYQFSSELYKGPSTFALSS